MCQLKNELMKSVEQTGKLAKQYERRSVRNRSIICIDTHCDSLLIDWRIMLRFFSLRIIAVGNWEL